MRVSPVCYSGTVSNVLKAELWGWAGGKWVGPGFVASVTIIAELGQKKKLIIIGIWVFLFRVYFFLISFFGFKMFWETS
jgi:hypothetical protein